MLGFGFQLQNPWFDSYGQVYTSARVKGRHTYVCVGEWKVWGDHQHYHPSNPSKILMLKNTTRVFDEISPLLWPLNWQNKLLIGDYPYKCVGNVPFCIYYLIHLIWQQTNNHTQLDFLMLQVHFKVCISTNF
jgi:hypothetical protein